MLSHEKKTAQIYSHFLLVKSLAYFDCTEPLLSLLLLCKSSLFQKLSALSKTSDLLRFLIKNYVSPLLEAVRRKPHYPFSLGIVHVITALSYNNENRNKYLV